MVSLSNSLIFAIEVSRLDDCTFPVNFAFAPRKICPIYISTFQESRHDWTRISDHLFGPIHFSLFTLVCNFD